MNIGQEPLAKTRTWDAVAASIFGLASLVHCACIATVDSPRGSTITETLINISLACLSVGFAVSGLRSSQKWAKAVSALVLGITLVHLLAPRVTMALVEMLYELIARQSG